MAQAQSIRRLRSRMVKSPRGKAPTKSKPEFRDHHAKLPTPVDGDGPTVIMSLPNPIGSPNIMGLPNIMGPPEFASTPDGDFGSKAVRQER